MNSARNLIAVAVMAGSLAATAANGMYRLLHPAG